MDTKRKTTVVLALLTIFFISAIGSDVSARRKRGKRSGPPPEAYTACEDKSVGDAAQLVDPRGETLTGTCEQEGERLVLRPDRSKMRSKGRDSGPPPEAYTACEGKSAGDAAEFVAPRGETVTGTCEQEGDRLALRPENPKTRPNHRIPDDANE